MALFHFTADQIKRSEGDSVIASAAYRSGEKLHSTYYGEDSDYTRKKALSVPKFSCRPMRRGSLPTGKPFGTP